MRVLALAAAVWTVALLAPLSANPGQFEKTAKKARQAIAQGDVTGSCHGCAKARLRGLVRRLVVLRFAPAGAGAVSTALCVANGESGFNPAAISRTGDWGTFQINRVSWDRAYDWARILDPAYNVNVGWAMSKHGTYWYPWVVWTHGNCN